MNDHASTGRSPFDLSGESALVTGGGTGLGQAVAEALLQAGAKVAIVGRRADVLRAAAERIGATPVAADITVMSELPALVQRAEDHVGALSILVNNAGVHLRAAAMDTDEAQLEQVLRTHVSAGFALSRAAARGMLERGRGSVVFVGSMAALMGVPQVSAYSAAKGALLALVPALASEWSPHGVRVNAVTPGWIDAGMAKQALDKDQARRRRVVERTPLSRLGQPSDIGHAVVYLCSDAARFITGSNLVVDGGASVGF
ncbi:MAG: SDR family oxidoreductase [Phycisphaeraceae bacterium]|nr:SDR family oxidoreductase [Phycisphaeraceae bacterium]